MLRALVTKHRRRRRMAPQARVPVLPCCKTWPTVLMRLTSKLAPATPTHLDDKDQGRAGARARQRRQLPHVLLRPLGHGVGEERYAAAALLGMYRGGGWRQEGGSASKPRTAWPAVFAALHDCHRPQSKHGIINAAIIGWHRQL